MSPTRSYFVQRGFIKRVFPYFLGFRNMGMEVGSVKTWFSRPALDYRIDGLLVWGASNETFFRSCTVGNVEALRLSEAPIPATFFRAEYPLSEFQNWIDKEQSVFQARSAEDRLRSEYCYGKLERVPLHYRFQRAIQRSMSHAEQISFAIEGPIDALMTFGVAEE